MMVKIVEKTLYKS